MTREEASKIIKDGLEDMSLDFADEEQYEALEMAIKALEQEPSGDLISRQAVLDLANTIQTDDFSGNELLEVVEVDDIKALPSVNPQEQIAQERYQDLVEYFGDKDIAKCVLEDREEFKKWLERIKWHVRKTDELARKLEQEPKTVSIPEGATNGDVVQIMFNKTFPKTIILYKNDESRLTINPMFSREWWERPYREEE